MASVKACFEVEDSVTLKMAARGIVPLPKEVAPQPVVTWDPRGVVWVNRPARGRLWGTLFTDGSSVRPATALGRRAGWAIVMVTPEGREVAAVYGAVPYALAPFQQARDGEDCCFWAMPHFCANVDAVHVDCAGTVACGQDRRVAIAPSNPRAHLWRRYWAELGPSVLVTKTKAHTTLADVHSGDTTMWEHLGNAAADRRARLGAQMHPWPEGADERLELAWEQALELASWAGWQEASQCLPPDTLEDIGAEERAIRSQAEAERRRSAGTLLLTQEADDDAFVAEARRLAAALT